MGLPDFHRLLSYFIYPMLGFGCYFLVMLSICIFLAFGEDSDTIRAKSIAKSRYSSSSRKRTATGNRD
jgi:hypothetical protein